MNIIEQIINDVTVLDPAAVSSFARCTERIEEAAQ